jgi:hypothetical protein
MSVAKTFPVFAASFAVIYVLSVYMNWAVVTYHPTLGEWEFLTQPPKSGPAMYWYGWIITSVLGATGLSIAALPLTGRFVPPAWLGWLVPLIVLIVLVYLFRTFFLR